MSKDVVRQPSHSTTPQQPPTLHSPAHSTPSTISPYEKNNSGWQVWESSDKLPSTPQANPEYGSYNTIPNVPATWTHGGPPAEGIHDRAVTNASSFHSHIPPPLYVSPGPVSAFPGHPLVSSPTGRQNFTPHHSSEDEFTRRIRAVTLQGYESISGQPPSNPNQVVSPTTLYNFPTPDYPFAYYAPGGELVYPFSPDPAYFPVSSPLLTHSQPIGMYSPPVSVPPHQPGHSVSNSRLHDAHPVPQGPMYFEYAPPSPVSPYMYHPSIPYPLAGPGHPPPPPQLHRPLDFQPNRHTGLRHTPRSASESFTSKQHHQRMQSGTFASTLGSPQESHFGARLTRREGLSRPRVVSVSKSPALERFRNTRGLHWNLSDVIGHTHEFSTDQYGSRFIQERLEGASREEIETVYADLLPDKALPLMSDVFGNYVIQKLFDYGTSVQRHALAEAMRGHSVDLTLHMYGCRVVQKAIECVSPEEHSGIIAEISPHVMECVKDTNGNHVIQRLIQCVEPPRLTVLDVLRDNILDLATHPYGCRVLLRCLEHLAQDQTAPLVEGIQEFSEQLVENQFGNYVVQYVLGNGRPHDRSGVISAMTTKFVKFARHKYASNVCEKALVASTAAERQVLIEELLKPLGENNAEGEETARSSISLLMKDQYGNYVVQKAMNVVAGEQKARLYTAVRSAAQATRSDPEGPTKNVQALERLLQKAGYHFVA